MEALWNKVQRHLHPAGVKAQVTLPGTHLISSSFSPNRFRIPARVFAYSGNEIMTGTLRENAQKIESREDAGRWRSEKVRVGDGNWERVQLRMLPRL